MMALKTLATATSLSIAIASAGFAAPVNFDFSITDGTNTITGLIEGLDSDADAQSASSITVYGVLDTYVFTSFLLNSFSVSGSSIDTNSVAVAAEINGQFFPPILNFFGSTGFLTEGPLAGPFQTFEGDLSFSVATVPLPVGGMLLLSGVVFVAGFKRRKKNKV